MSYLKIAVVNSSSFGKKFKNHQIKLNELGKVDYFNFENNITGKELAQKLRGYNIIIASVTPNFDKEFFINKDELILISRHGVKSIILCKSF